MAIRLADYFPTHVRRIIWAASSMQAATLAALGILLYTAGFSLTIIMVYVLLPVVLLQTFALIFILRYALEPLESLTRAITYVSKQASDVTPPNLNGTHHEKTGLKLMVDTIYGLASADAAQPTDTTVQAPEGTADTAKVLEAAPAGIIALDASGAIVYANSSAPVTTDTQGNTSVSLVFMDENTSLTHWLDDNAESAVNATKMWTRIADAIPGESDTRKLYDVVATYRKAGEGGIETVIVTIDRTSTYLVDEEDTDFIALAAHELRGPITIIRGYIDVLSQDLKEVIQGDQQELLDRLDVSASRLSSYVSNILNVARYDRRHLKLHLTEDRLSNVYAAIADDLQLRARTQNRLLSVNIPETLPTVAADRNSLSEVLANLVDNAIKYSNEGGHVDVTAVVDGDFVRCNVVDNGIGIPASVVGSLFTKFYRSHRSRQDVTGTGLGLYISKGIIESHGGRIGVSSKEGEGSTFTFSVPIYSTVADKLLAGDDTVMKSASGWIKNHATFRG
jgi:signal transduction histidine kinase